MLSADTLRSLQERFQMTPVVALLQLPDTGISLIRWQRHHTVAASHVFSIAPLEGLDGYLLSLILRPMRAVAWLGARQVWAGGIASHTIRLTPTDARPSFKSDSPFDIVHIIIPRGTIDSIAGSLAVHAHEQLRAMQPYARDDTIHQLGCYMLDAAVDADSYSRPFADSVGRALVTQLLRRCSVVTHSADGRGLGGNDLRRVKDYIAGHLDGQLRVQDLAEIAGLSESHFAQAFRRSTGVTPHHYIVSARIDRSRSLLRDTRRSILDISLECGFKDASHFTRVFKTIVGITPHLYRRGS